VRFSRPSSGTILAAAALFVALGGTTMAATGTVVNIADPNNPAQVAAVDNTGALKTTVQGFVGPLARRCRSSATRFCRRSRRTT
jgi:hypothetical protein